MAFNPNEHLMDLKGKQYLQVMWRLVWFREEKPLWSIDTKLEQLTENHAVFSAKISDENGVQKASGYGSESMKDFRDFIEKAETKAIGRALAMLGYGTQFSPELDEGERIVDSPVEIKPPKKAPEKAPVKPAFCEYCKEQITDGKRKDGSTWPAADIAKYSRARFKGSLYCPSCMRIAFDAEKRARDEEQLANEAEALRHEDAGDRE